MAVYLLDKNVVEDIKKSLRGIPTKGAAVARGIDRKGNTASPLLSIMEGSMQRAQSGPELHDQLMADTQAVGLFYNLAKTDSKYLRDFDATTVTALAPHMREKTDPLVPLTKALQALVVKPRRWDAAREVLKEIDALADKHEVNLAHPLITCAVATLYGSGPARGVLKPAVTPTDGGAYNAVADIRIVMETAYIRQMWNENGRRESVQLLSNDKDLNAFAKLSPVRVDGSFLASPTGSEIISFSATISENLLPILRSLPKEMHRVFDYLQTSRDANKSFFA
jgi:hypothetical protein